jgi:hypothetical protein
MYRQVMFIATSLLTVLAPHAYAGPVQIDLASAAGFAVLAGSGVTNTGTSVVTGNVGVFPGTSVVGFPPGVVVNGQIYDGDAVAMQAQSDALAAYTEAAAETGGQSLTGQNLGGLTLTPGIYSFSSAAQLTGTLTLNAENLQNAVFIFQIASTLTTATGSLVSFINGQADEVIWQVGSSATLGGGSVFDGDILALTSVTLDSGASIDCGGALALNGAVTLQSNDISVEGASCGAGQMQVPEPAALLVFLSGCAVLMVGRAGLRVPGRKIGSGFSRQVRAV